MQRTILQGLAADGAENNALAVAARRAWPQLLTHALTYVDDEPNVYNEGTWGSWAAAALFPNPLAWTEGMYNELSGPPIDWVEPTKLTDLVDRWLLIGRGKERCVDALIRLVRMLPIEEQATRGLGWVADLCIQGGRVTVDQSWSSNDGLKEIRAAVEEHGPSRNGKPWLTLSWSPETQTLRCSAPRAAELTSASEYSRVFGA